VDEEFDLYIIDVKLPKNSGIELLKKINSKAIIITAYASGEIIDKAFKLGAVDFIKKPIFKEELLHKVQKILPQNLTIKNYTLSPEKYTLTNNDKSITLTKTEVDFLLLFTKKDFVSLEEIYNAIQKENNALYTFLTRLKNKTGLEFENVKGLGYKLKM
jgi:DNA-binding response OmpR family regulator